MNRQYAKQQAKKRLDGARKIAAAAQAQVVAVAQAALDGASETDATFLRSIIERADVPTFEDGGRTAYGYPPSICVRLEQITGSYQDLATAWLAFRRADGDLQLEQQLARPRRHGGRGRW